ncbi:uncharacterized protein LOC117649284 isoform X2 [Thrips palmi]|uniref:Uncharacterized protein LOC117649284 isoform X2 n=1 Tax=Thrips palmi TaxID=161013 RepID=A0A6P8ZRK9_THRPL|nr:uncharacterized protein LOC117649284 isoform X2 [Thrips palmi]
MCGGFLSGSSCRNFVLRRTSVAMDSEAMVEPEISLLSLPDDALLAVLAFLSPRELFACRVACRRLRDLCLHQHLWRAASVESEGVLRAALALAPCIGTIAKVPMEALEPLVSASACTVSGLELSVYGEKSVALALALLSRFSAVSSGLRLTKLTLHLSSCLPNATASLIFQALYAFNGLQDLTFDNDLDSAVLGELEVLPSLRKLILTSSSTGAFFNLMLRTHFATLEDVDISYLKTDVPWSSLASLSRLRSLTCYQGEGLSHLAALPIAHLDISIEEDDACAPGALEFLSKASHLRTVKLSATRNVIKAPLLALGKSLSAPTLESLDVNGDYDFRWAGVATMVTPVLVLSKFLSLKSLILTINNEPLPEDLLQAVSPTSSPCLTMLELHVKETLELWFNDSESETSLCLHEAVHGPFVLDLFVRNPRLHLRVVEWYRYYCKDCSWCWWGCHARLHREAVVSLSSHSLGAGCPLDCYQVIKSGGRPHAAG